MTVATRIRHPLSVHQERRKTLSIVAIFLVLLQLASSFNLRMEYQPPVKSSVKKLHGNRFHADDMSKHSNNGQSSKKMTNGASTSLAAPYPSTSSDAKEDADSFESRMRELVLRNAAARKAAPARTVTLPTNMHTVGNLEEFKEIVTDEQEKVVVVKFYAKWCRACKAMQPYFYEMARRNPSVKFVEIAATEQNTNLHQGLGVATLPFGHIYHPQKGLVEGLKLTRKDIGVFEKQLRSHL